MPTCYRSAVMSGIFCLVLAFGLTATTRGLTPNFVTTATAQEAPAKLRHPTDETTRAAMVAIRDLVANNHSLVTHRRMPKVQAQSMAKKVASQLKKIRKASELKGDARMELAQILALLDQGARAVAGREKEINPIDGIVMMDEALAQYENQFDHPDWKAPREL